MIKAGKMHERLKPWRVWLAMFLVLHAYAPISYAQTFAFSSRKKIAIVGFQHGEKPAQEQKAYENIRETMQAQDHLLVLDRSTVSQSLSAQSSTREDELTQAKIEAAYEEFVKGVESYQNLNLTQAITQLENAVRGYRSGISALRDNHYLLYAHLYLGMALFFDGRPDDGKRFILEMIKLDPNRNTRTLPARDFPPTIVEIHRSLTQKIQKIANGTLNVTSTPAGATVILDGMEVGKTPMDLHNIPQGKHFLGVVMPGHEMYSRLVEVGPGPQKVAARLTAEKMFYAQNQFEQEKNQTQEQLMQKVAKDLAVDTFVLGQVTQNDKGQTVVEIQSYDVTNRKFSSVYTKTLSKKERKHASQYVSLTKQWLEQQGLDRALAESTLIPDQDFSDSFQAEPPPSVSKPFLGLDKKKWLWIGVGAVVLGGSLLLLSGGSDDPSGNVLNVTNPLAP